MESETPKPEPMPAITLTPAEVFRLKEMEESQLAYLRQRTARERELVREMEELLGGIFRMRGVPEEAMRKPWRMRAEGESVLFEQVEDDGKGR